MIGHATHGRGAEGVIVLHGWFGDHTVYAPMFPYLDTDTFTYAFMDCRGYGTSREIPGRHTMAEISADAIALAEHLGWQRFHVVGHSMGGMAVQRLALDARDRVKSGVAVTPVPASGTQFQGEVWDLFSGAPDNDDNRRGIVAHSVRPRPPSSRTVTSRPSPGPPVHAARRCGASGTLGRSRNGSPRPPGRWCSTASSTRGSAPSGEAR